MQVIKKVFYQHRTIAVFLIPFFLLLAWLLNAQGAGNGLKYYKVGYSSFELKVFARGELVPRKLHHLVSNVSNDSAKLVFLKEEGSEVKEGDIVARFDTRKFEEELIEAEQKYADALATLDFAQKTSKIQMEAEAKKIEAASSELELSKLAANEQLEGLAKIQRQQFVIELEQAKRSLNIASAEADDFNVLYTKGHVSLREFEKAQDEADKLTELVQLKQQALEAFDKYSYPMTLKEIEVQITTAEADYNRAHRLSELEIQKHNNAIVKAQRDVERARKRVDIAKANIESCTIRAPINGGLYHSTLMFQGVKRKITVGDNIWSGQNIVFIPDTSAFNFIAYVREFDVSKISQGMQVQVELDSIIGNSLGGVVRLVNRIAADESGTGINLYPVEIELGDSGSYLSLHTGMQGQAGIVVQEVHDTLIIPVSALIQENQQYFVSTVSNQKRAIEIGKFDESWVEVTSGLKAGEVILH